MRIYLIFLVFVLFACEDSKERYEMVHFGKSKESPAEDESLLIRIDKGEEISFQIVHPDDQQEIKEILYGIGKGDLIELKEKVGDLPKETRIELLDSRKTIEVKSFEKGIESFESEESILLAEYLFQTKTKFEYRSGCFIKEVVKSGSGIKGIKNSIYRVDMECELLSGKKVYSTTGSSTLFEFNKSMPGQVTEGLGIVMDMMEVGDEYEVLIPSAMCFGKDGIEGLVPPNAPLLYRLKLIEIII